MAKCTISIPLTKAPDIVIEAAKKRIADAGGKMEGDTASGTFQVSIPVMGKIAGDYRMSSDAMVVDVNEKPFVLPCGKIEEWLKKQLG